MLSKASEDRIRGEYSSYNKMKLLALQGNKEMLSQFLLETSKTSHNNARWGNIVDVHISMKNKINELLYNYYEKEISAKDFIAGVADAIAEAVNDQRDGLLLIDELFGVQDGMDTAENEKNLLEQWGTTNWKTIYRMTYPDLFKK